jgi:NAD(P)-dependent dehydrogenase (short-subunit alcohol dehydrogenase family)
MTGKLSGKVALVTGGSRSIGAAIVKRPVRRYRESLDLR